MTVSISFTNTPNATIPVDLVARYRSVVDTLPLTLRREVCYFLPGQPGSSGDGMDFLQPGVTPQTWNALVMAARPYRVAAYIGCGESTPPPPTGEALAKAVRAYRGAACVYLDAFAKDPAAWLPVAQAFADIGITVGIEANKQDPIIAGFVGAHPGTRIIAESWLWTGPYTDDGQRYTVAEVRAIGGVPVAMVNRRVSKGGTVGWTTVSEADWPDKKVSLTYGFAAQGADVLLRTAGVDAGELTGIGAVNV